MSNNIILQNLIRVASDMLSQFSTDEPLISDETKEILNNEESRVQLIEALKHPKNGPVTITLNGKEHIYFVES
ncbi:hypothetical protein WG904_03395 [Pedobacter sp. Du54]|uniref:hypothetical protein n=1 Tax=Pedobacter anseongensis TaxID=3133439 RepID=UPI0030AEEE29